MPTNRHIVTAIALILFQGGFANAQPAGPDSSSATSQPTSTSEAVANDREALLVDLARARAAIEELTAAEQEIPPALRSEFEQLGRLDRLFAQLDAALDHETELKASFKQRTDALESLRVRGPPEAKPYTFQLHETLRDQLATESARGETRSDAIEAGQAAVTAAKAARDQAERNRRQAKEALESNKDDAKAPALANALRIAQLESRAAAEELRLREIELKNQKLEDELRNLQLTTLKEKIAQISKEIEFSQEELNEYLLQIEKTEIRLTQALERATADFQLRDAEWIEVRRRIEASPTKDQALVEEFEARELIRRSRQREMALIGEQLDALSYTRKVWERRYSVFNSGDDEAEIRKWEAETRKDLAKIKVDLRQNSARLTELRREAVTLDSKINASGEASAESKRWLDQQKRHLDGMIRNYETNVDQLESARRLHEKLLSEISTQVETVTWTEWLRAAWLIVLDVWNYEITSVQDSPITVQKIVIGIILLLVGIFASRIIARWFGRRFLPRFGLNEGGVAALQSILFYLLVLTVVMLSLRIVNVPLTAFTILGGALAIGIGFGSQNIVNNFISGLILLAERPIRVGDLVEIDELIGVIEHIGPRSTRVRSPSNMDIIVPNSSFLEKNVINWTLTDDRYRTQISVGVIYGSPTRDVVRLIRKSLDEHGKVLPKPEPIILFADFGDNALIFEAHFWVRMRRIMDRRVIESDIRSRIDSLFREAGIVVAFPQRDVHLDSTSPIQIQMLPSATVGDSDASSVEDRPDDT